MSDVPVFRLDPYNANKGTTRGLGQLERSMQTYGAARSAVATADDVILAGNKSYETAKRLGLPVRVVETDGQEFVVVKRRDLQYSDPRAKELGIADNRASETGLEWDAEVLAAFAEDGIDLSQFWFEDELADVLDVVPDFEPVGIEEQGRLDEKAQVECPECGHRFTP